ncbi:MAG TPA: pilus assembly protein N-terminal domain-containing protein [Myxococcales bacterium]|jgi:pilus assembly protein CpaC
MNLALVLAVVLSAEPSEAPVRVSPGMQEVLKVPGLTKAALADPTIADVTVTGPGELLILGKKQGKTSLTLWTKATKNKPATRMIYVDDGKFAELSALVKEKVDPTLKTEVFGDKLVIDGQLDTVEDYQRLKALTADYSNVKLLVKLSASAMNIVAGQINGELRRQGISGAAAKVMGGRMVLEGSVQDEAERAKAQMIAESYYADFGKK